MKKSILVALIALGYATSLFAAPSIVTPKSSYKANGKQMLQVALTKDKAPVKSKAE